MRAPSLILASADTSYARLLGWTSVVPVLLLLVLLVEWELLRSLGGPPAVRARMAFGAVAVALSVLVILIVLTRLAKLAS